MQDTNKSNGQHIAHSNQMEALSDYVFITKYAKYDHKKKRRETWPESVNRVRDMHLHRFATKGVDADIHWAFDTMVRDEKRVLPSMRSMQFGGDAVIANDARIYNCSYTLADRQRFFSEMFWLLLSGCGVGFSVQRQHVAKLPELINHIGQDEKSIMTYMVEDTIEGWADALDILMSSYFKGNPLSGKEVFFDFSKIRRKGSWLKTSGGRAPGAKPLRIALKQIRRVLHEVVEDGQMKLRPIQVYDIAMMAADAVLSGGIRRSATICLFSYDDEEMMSAKTFSQKGRILSDRRRDGSWVTTHGDAVNLSGDLKQGDEVTINWYNIMPWRARSNNSVALLRSSCTREQFTNIISKTRNFGEPGFIFLENLDYGCNPCNEIMLNPIDAETGETGFAFCNLSEINGGKIKTIEDFKSAVRAATIIGTLQAGYTWLNYLTDATRRIVRRERLLGVSLTGWMENPTLLLDPIVQREMAKYAIAVNQEFAARLEMEPSARITCTKPAGTSSLILGTSSGIHPHHARHYFRRIQQSDVEQTFQFFKAHNQQAIEKSVWGATDEVVTFCIEAPETAIVKDDLSAVQLLEIVKKTWENWVLVGTARPDSSPGAVHNVSNTIEVAEHEWNDVTDYIFNNRHCFSGVSLLPKVGDKLYQQAPNERVVTVDDINKWNMLVELYKPVDWSKLEEAEDHTSVRHTVACAGGACSII